jgi:cellulose synthase/poly-beta-1,6-N-acetylglucosamine synthase-like glycosyltransferase
VTVHSNRETDWPGGIVVIGRNESARLPACLASVAQYRGHILYADSASTDDSTDIARSMGAVVVELDGSTPLTPARGRNEGYRAFLDHFPDCEFIQFVDGDSVIIPDWIETAWAFLRENDRVAVVCGHVIEEHPQSSIYNWLCSDEWKGPVGQIDACGGNAMVRVAALEETGGFRADLVAGEEAELMARMRSRGWEIWRVDAPMVAHDADIHRFADWWARARRGGFASANVWWLTRHLPERLYGAQLRSALLWTVILPLGALALSALLRSPAFLGIVPVAWLLQMARISVRRGALKAQSWAYAALIMLAKVPETAGALGFGAMLVRGGASTW